MTPWIRVTGALKDKGSIWVTKFAPATILRNPVLETAVIKATSHDEHHIDYKNVERVMQWLAASPLQLKPLIFSLSLRMKKTRSWPVALKGLMLMHGIFCCQIPALQKIGRLPFDLSDFTDRHSRSDKVWAFNAFVRSYFTYLDQRSAFVSSEYQKKSKQRKEIEVTLMHELEKLQKMQTLIDTILKIRPLNGRMNNVALILEAMDCVVVELSDLYGKFCAEISRILLRIYDMGGKMEANAGLHVVQKAAVQGEELAYYFELCRDMGVVHASRRPKIERISEENIPTLERMANEDHEEMTMIKVEYDECHRHQVIEKNEEKSIVALSKQGSSGTVITEKWEIFEDDNTCFSDGNSSIISSTNPFLDDSYTLVPYNPVPPQNQVLSDLITF